MPWVQKRSSEKEIAVAIIGRVDRGEDIIHSLFFTHKTIGPAVGAAFAVKQFILGGNDDDFSPVAAFSQLLQNVYAAEFRNINVDDQQVRLHGFGGLYRMGAAVEFRCDGNAVAVEKVANGDTCQWMIVNDYRIHGGVNPDMKKRAMPGAGAAGLFLSVP
jgi:hypothetical protein